MFQNTVASYTDNFNRRITPTSTMLICFCLAFLFRPFGLGMKDVTSSPVSVTNPLIARSPRRNGITLSGCSNGISSALPVLYLYTTPR